MRRLGRRRPVYLAGLALFAAGILGGRSGVLSHPVALAVFAVGALIAATTIRPADRGRKS